MGKITKIDNAAISEALHKTRRQYLAGQLARPQIINFIQDDRLEIGLSSYPEFQAEAAHQHSQAREYQYLISGWTKYLDLETGQVFAFHPGDFYAIEAGTAYAQKVTAGTKILFIKVPAGDDKQLAETSQEQLAWLEEKMTTVRTDYYHQEDAPAANSLKPAAAVVVLNSKKELLMLEGRANQKWTLPGGTLELGESMTECAVREVKEECGLDVRIKDIIGIYSDPDIRVAYSDGEVRQEFTLVYFAEALNFAVTVDDESSRFKWVCLDELPGLALAESQRQRMMDVRRYLTDMTRSFK